MTQEEKETTLECLKEELANLWNKWSETYRKNSLESSISVLSKKIADLKREYLDGLSGDEVEAYKIADGYPMPPDATTVSDAKAMIRNGAMQMAEWKDGQFMGLINDKLEYARAKIDELHGKQQRLKYEGMRKVLLEIKKEIENGKGNE